MLKALIHPLITVIVHDCLVTARRPGAWAMPILFFIMITALFSIVFPYGPNHLADIAPTVLWVTAVLSTLLSLESLFQVDFSGGILEQLVLSHHPLSLLMLGKTLSHWLTIGLPLTLIAPLLAIPLYLPKEGVWGLVVTLSLGMPLLSLLGTIGASLTYGLHQGGLFLAILVLPLMFPVLLLGVSGVFSASQGLPWAGQVAFLAALLIITLCLAPMTIAAAVRVTINSG
jgi:heme exporter protein B